MAAQLKIDKHFRTK